MPDTPAHELPFAWLDGVTRDDARAALARCCASSRWVEAMLERRPFGSSASLCSAAREVWAHLGRTDYLEAFAGHPPLGARTSAMRERFASTHGWSREEQAGVEVAEEAVLAELERANQAYLERFGYLFIACATGKTAPELLALLRERLPNAPDRELLVAAAEQANITELRLEKLRP